MQSTKERILLRRLNCPGLRRVPCKVTLEIIKFFTVHTWSPENSTNTGVDLLKTMNIFPSVRAPLVVVV